MKFKVTGGADGVSGIEFQGRRYEAGAEVDMTAKQAEWLVEQGYLESPEAAAKRATAPVEVVEVAPVSESTTLATSETPDDTEGEI